MFRLICLLTLFCAPLLAEETNFVVREVGVDVRLTQPEGSGVTAAVSCKLSVRNDGVEAGTLQLAIPMAPIPIAKEHVFIILIDGVATEPESDSSDIYRWSIQIEPAQSITLAWSYTAGTTLLPNLHPLGRRRLIVPLANLRTLGAMPEFVTIKVRHSGLPAALFRDSVLDFTHPGGQRVQDFTFEWFATTIAEKRAQLEATRAGFNAKQQSAENRSYTLTLVQLADVLELADDYAALAKTCDTLARLEASGALPITHCGPGAIWRRYVPWCLRQLAAQEKTGDDTKQAASEARAIMEPRWKAYLHAKDTPRPFDQFDRKRFGNYWDYDWARTRELYARALEVLGDEKAAANVREAEEQS